MASIFKERRLFKVSALGLDRMGFKRFFRQAWICLLADPEFARCAVHVTKLEPRTNAAGFLSTEGKRTESFGQHGKCEMPIYFYFKVNNLAVF